MILVGIHIRQATADGLKLRGDEVHGPDGDRPFVLSRAFFAGTQVCGLSLRNEPTDERLSEWLIKSMRVSSNYETHK
jgi:hypothetical protein